VTDGRYASSKSAEDSEPRFVVGRSPRSWVARWPWLQRLYWDLHSRWWDDVEHRYGVQDDLAVLEWLEGLRGPRRMRALDLGCGTGTHAAALVASGLDVVGIDISPGMLRRARAKTRPRGPGTAVFLRATLNETLPVAGVSFDAVLCLAVMSTITDETRLLGEARRVLRPGGMLVVRVVRFTPVTPYSGTVSGALFALGKVLPGWQGRLGKRTRGELLGLLFDAGFRVVEERATSATLTLLTEKVR
jgi:ubiquinone/menaquinone biosynthesis C-methylase UbiE